MPVQLEDRDHPANAAAERPGGGEQTENDGKDQRLMGDFDGETAFTGADAARDQGGAANGDQHVVAGNEPGKILYGRLGSQHGGLMLGRHMPREKTI